MCEGSSPLTLLDCDFGLRDLLLDFDRSPSYRCSYPEWQGDYF